MHKEKKVLIPVVQTEVIYLSERKCWRGTGIPEEEGVDYGEGKAWSENLWTGWKMVTEPGTGVSRCNKCGNI